jgi:ribose transport system permease protein
MAKNIDSAVLDSLVSPEKVNVLRRASRVQAFQIMLVLFAITFVFSALKPTTFMTIYNFRNIVVNTSIFAVLGVGMTFVIITAGIDLSIGSVLIFSSVISCKVMASMGGQGWGAASVGIVIALLVGGGCGFINGWLVSIARVPAFIVTLGSLGAALGLAQIITGGIDLTTVPQVFVNSVGFGNIVGQIPTLAVISLVVAILGGIVLHKTRFGLLTYAVGSNPEGCRRVGINVNRHLIYVYTIMGVLAGLAGILSLAFYQQTTIAGQSSTALTIIAGVVIGGSSLFGGYGSIFGTVVGLLIPAVLQNGFIIIGIVPYWQNVVVGVFLVAAVFVDTTRREAAEGGHNRLKKRSQVGSNSKKGKE